MKKENLTTKNIREFQIGDSLYMLIPEKGKRYKNLLLVSFLSFEEKEEEGKGGGKVKGTVISSYNDPKDCTNGQIETPVIQTTIIEAALYQCSLYGKWEMSGNDYPCHHPFDSLGYAIYSSPEEKSLRVPEEHESYGIISLHKTNYRSPKPCFGAVTLQNQTYNIEICEGRVKRSMHNDWYSSKEEIITIELTAQQLVELLTNSSGAGIPATILSKHKKRMEDCPFVSKVEQFDTEFELATKEINRGCKSSSEKIMEVLNSGKPTTKKEKEYINSLLVKINQEIEENLPFISKQFSEQMEKVINEAKTTLNTHVKKEKENLGIPEKGNGTGDILGIPTCLSENEP